MDERWARLGRDCELLLLDQALDELTAIDPGRAASWSSEFGGLSEGEVAEVLALAVHGHTGMADCASGCTVDHDRTSTGTPYGPPSWARVKEVIQVALARSPGERAAFVLRTCGEDGALQAKVQSLLSAIDQRARLSLGPRFNPSHRQPACPPARYTTPQTASLDPEILSVVLKLCEFLGAGGMGDVFRARDDKLNRDVALKIAPSAYELDPDRLARFRREARALAALNHPNIAAIYGLEESRATSPRPRARRRITLADEFRGPCR